MPATSPGRHGALSLRVQLRCAAPPGVREESFTAGVRGPPACRLRSATPPSEDREATNSRASRVPRMTSSAIRQVRFGHVRATISSAGPVAQLLDATSSIRTVCTSARDDGRHQLSDPRVVSNAASSRGDFAHDDGQPDRGNLAWHNLQRPIRGRDQSPASWGAAREAISANSAVRTWLAERRRHDPIDPSGCHPLAAKPFAGLINVGPHARVGRGRLAPGRRLLLECPRAL